MRKLMWFTLGFAAGCGVGVMTMKEGIPLTAALAPAILAMLAGLLGRKRKFLRCAALLCLGSSVGLGWFSGFQNLYLRTAAMLDGMEQPITATVTDYSYETNYGVAADAVTELEGKSYRIRIYLNEKTPLEPGDRVSGNFRFRLTTPDAIDGTYHSGHGIFLLAYGRGAYTREKGTDESLAIFASRLANSIKTVLKTCFEEDVFPFAKALLLGDTYDLDYETDTAFQVSGVRHVIAVSGLHVSILFGMLSFVTLKKRYLTALAGFPLLFVFAAVAGFTPSVTRACIMAALMLLALLLNKEYDGPTALSFAVLGMLAANPLVITAVGFQLSVVSVAGIFLFSPGISQWLRKKLGEEKGRSLKKRLKFWLASSVSVSLSAVVLTTPLSAYYFGTVSLIGPVTNLLVLWVISAIFYGITAVCLTSLFWLPGAVVLARVVAWPIRCILWLTQLLGRFPLAAVYTESGYIVAWLVFVYMLLGLFLLQKNRRPLALTCCAVIGLCLALMASWLEPLTGSCRMTVLDVGQGQSILLQSSGKTYLVDCGGDSDEMTADLVARTLLSQGISRLDGMILTHLDRDHAGGAEFLLTRIETDLLFLPYNADPDSVSRITEHTDGDVIWVKQDAALSWGDTDLRIFGPYYSGTDNENSLCILFDTKKCDILITGDRSGFGERLLLRKNVIGDIDILVAGHHGSDSSTCTELLEAVKPEIVCISVSEDNSYGHPGKALLARLAQHGCSVYRTDQHGTIILRR